MRLIPPPRSATESGCRASGTDYASLSQSGSGMKRLVENHLDKYFLVNLKLPHTVKPKVVLAVYVNIFHTFVSKPKCVLLDTLFIVVGIILIEVAVKGFQVVFNLNLNILIPVNPLKWYHLSGLIESEHLAHLKVVNLD